MTDSIASSALPKTMRAAVITTPGGPEVLRIEQRPLPIPASREVLVRVHGSAMNRADVLQRQGRYPPPPGAPADVPGMEIAGTVAALGAGVTRWTTGARVFGLVAGGAHADYAVAHEDTLCLVPDTLDWTLASAVPEAFITANDALGQARMAQGDVVLIHAVASGVGLAAVQLVRARGGLALGTSRSGGKMAAARELGLADGFEAGHGLDGLAAWVRERSGGKGADVALDLVGGAYFAPTLDALAVRGRMMLIGTVAGAEATIPLGVVLRKRLTIRGTVLRSRALDERAADARAFERDVVPLLLSGKVQPVIDRVFTLDEIGDAHRAIESNSTIGKVVLRMTQDH
ncbi:MAG: NAD(P)H-quinone oxidoreductase [Gemmatimonadaceae bacterium]